MVAAYTCVLATLICAIWMYEDVLGAVMLVTKSCAAFIRISTLKILVSWYPREIIGVVSSALQVSSCFGEMVSRSTVPLLLQRYPIFNVWISMAMVTSVCLLPALFFVHANPSTIPEGQKKYHFLRSLKSWGKFSRWKSTLSQTTLIPKPPPQQVEIEINDGASAQQETRAAEEKAKRLAILQKSFYREIVLPLMLNPRFWCMLVMSFLVAAQKESLLEYTPQLFHHAIGTTPEAGGSMSGLGAIPAAISIALFGFIFDRVPRYRRSLIPPICYLISWIVYIGFYLFLQALPDPSTLSEGEIQKNRWLTACFLVTTIFFSTGPSSYLDGAYAIQIGGLRGTGFAAGVASGVGYAGATVLTKVFGGMVESLEDWRRVIFYTVVMTGIVVLLSVVYGILEWRQFHVAEQEERDIAHSQKQQQQQQQLQQQDTTPKPHLINIDTQ